MSGNNWVLHLDDDARWTAAIGRIDAALAETSPSQAPAMVGFALVMLAALQAAALTVLL